MEKLKKSVLWIFVVIGVSTVLLLGFNFLSDFFGENEEVVTEEVQTESVADTTTQSNEEDEVLEGSLEQTITEEESDTTLNSEEDQEWSEQIFLGSMREDLGEFVHIEFNEQDHVYEMLPIKQQLINEIEAYGYSGQYQDEWDHMVEGLVSYSVTAKDFLGEGYGIALLHPNDPDGLILYIQDGNVPFSISGGALKNP